MISAPGSNVYNGTGADTDVFSAGMANPFPGGGDTIHENAGGGSITLAFHGIDPSAVTMWDNNSGYLMVQYSPTDQISGGWRRV